MKQYFHLINLLSLRQYFNVHMKSQFYQEIQSEHHKIRSLNLHKHAKKVQPNLNNNSIALHNRNFKSEKRSDKKVNKFSKAKIDTDMRMMKVSQSKLNITEQKSNTSVYQQDRISEQKYHYDYEKRIKQINMFHEQYITEERQNYLLLQKKYLMTQRQLLKLQQSYHELHDINLMLKDRENQYERVIQNEKALVYSLQQQNDNLNEQIRKTNQKNSIFNYFLTIYLQQTKMILQWAIKLQNIHSELPPIIQNLKEDILTKRVDLEVTLKQGNTYQKENFGQSTIRNIYEESRFLPDEQNGYQSFMRYLGKDSSIKKASQNIKPFSLQKSSKKQYQSNNKQNIQNINRQCFKDIINNQYQNHINKHKIDIMSQQYLRMLLLQAHTIQESRQNISLSLKSNMAQLNKQFDSHQTSSWNINLSTLAH